MGRGRSRGRGRICGTRKKMDRANQDEGNGFGEWGGYMEAKKAKLLDQFHTAEVTKTSDIFKDVAIHVNGLTKPPIQELKNLMATHEGVFHMYQVSTTTHIIASNLPNVKINKLGTVPIVKPSWITDSISLGKLLDYRRYLLYTNQSTTQPRIDFPVVEKPVIEPVKEPVSLNEKCNASIVDRAETSHRFPTKTASDPNFLEEFYNNSRLHLISTLGAEYKQLVGKMREKSDGMFPGKEALIKEKGKNVNTFLPNSVIMHVDMDCFFVSVGLRSHPELRGKPVAITHARNGQVTHARPNQKSNRELEFALYSERLPEGAMSRVDKIDAQSSMSEIASCSYEARKCGIKNGMFLGQAVKLCPELKTLQYDFEGYKEVSNTLYQTIASYTLDIEAVSCDEMYVDVTKILRETGLSVEEWASHIRNEIMAITGCPCSAGFGANRLQARLATRRAKPSGQYYLQADDVDEYMAEIPLADLPGVGHATLAKLRNLGLNTCGDVQMASLSVLQSEIGQKAGETLKEQSRGLDRKPLNFHHERKSVSAEINYGIRFKTQDECYDFLQSLSKEVYSRLSDIKMRARCLTLKLLIRAAEAPVETAKFLGHGVCDSLSKSTTSNSVINDPQVIFREVKTLYDKINPPFADLRGIGIQLSKLEKNAPTSKAMSAFLKKGTVAKNEVTSKKNCEPNNLANDFANVDQIPECMTNFLPCEEPDSQIGKKKEQEDADRKMTGKKIETVRKAVALRKPLVKSKRGRPRGSSNSGKSWTFKNLGSCLSLSNFVGRNESQNKPQQVKNKYLIASTLLTEEVDLNVLNELPKELREEIIRDYGLENKIKQYTSTLTGSNVKHENVKPMERQKLSVTIVENKNTVTARTSPFSGLTWNEIKPIVMKWTLSENEPSDVDTEMIAKHFKQLAVDRKIEDLKRVFNFLHRTFSKLNCLWHKSYYTIVNITQEGMVARYGGTLMVERKFDCCHM